jgi:tetratricopeptide (TPR) repeat protein
MKLRILIASFINLLLSASLAAQDTRENADFTLAVNLYHEKLYDLALEQLQQFIHASIKKQRGNLQEAIGIWKLVAADSRHASREMRSSAPLELGDAYLALRDVATVLQQFEKAASMNARRSGEAWYKAARVAGQLQQSRKAAEYYAQAFRDSAGVVHPRGLLAGASQGAILSERYAEFERRFPASELILVKSQR